MRTSSTPAARSSRARLRERVTAARDPEGRGPSATWARTSAKARSPSKRSPESPVGVVASAPPPHPPRTIQSVASSAAAAPATGTAGRWRGSDMRDTLGAMSQGHMDRLTAIDASFLTNESSTSHMHIGAVTIFEGPPPGYEDLLDHVESRLHLVPRYRQKLAFPRSRPGGRSGSTTRSSTSATTSATPPSRPRRRDAAAADGRSRLLPAARPDEAALGALARRGAAQAALRADLARPTSAGRRGRRGRHRDGAVRRQAGARADRRRAANGSRARARPAPSSPPAGSSAVARTPVGAARRLARAVGSPRAAARQHPGGRRGRRRGRLGARQPGARAAAQRRRSAPIAATPGCAATSAEFKRIKTRARRHRQRRRPLRRRRRAAALAARPRRPHRGPRAAGAGPGLDPRRPTSTASSATRSPPSAGRCRSTSRTRSRDCGRSARRWTGSSPRRRRSAPR